MTGTVTARFPWPAVSLLGLLAIVGYGSWYYSFGVLLEPILTDTGWSERWLVTSFSATGLAGALAAPTAGRLIDGGRVRPVLAAAGAVAAVGLGAASFSRSLPVFVVTTGVGAAAIAAFAHYHVTQTLAVRLAPDASTRSVGIVTLYGAFASTIYLPLAAVLVEVAGWRVALRVLAVIVGIVLGFAAAALPTVSAAAPRSNAGHEGGLLADPVVRRYAVATFGIGIAAGIVLVYQVTIMTAAGLSLTVAAWLAGARGTAQFLGRLPVVWMVHRIGSTRSLQIAFASIGVGCAFLAFSGNPVIGMGYVLIAGFGIGATSPLQGIHGSLVFPPERLGQGLGTMSLVFGSAMAIGPTAIALTSAGSVRWPAIATAMVGSAVAVLALRGPVPHAAVAA